MWTDVERAAPSCLPACGSLCFPVPCPLIQSAGALPLSQREPRQGKTCLKDTIQLSSWLVPSEKVCRRDPRGGGEGKVEKFELLCEMRRWGVSV